MKYKFVSSRITNGNSIFPNEIHIDNFGVTLRIPGVFSDDEQTIPFSQISSVNIECPFVGFSKIIIETTGQGKLLGYGFLKKEVVEMKKIILSFL